MESKGPYFLRIGVCDLCFLQMEDIASFPDYLIECLIVMEVVSVVMDMRLSLVQLKACVKDFATLVS